MFPTQKSEQSYSEYSKANISFPFIQKSPEFLRRPSSDEGPRIVFRKKFRGSIRRSLGGLPIDPGEIW